MYSNRRLIEVLLEAAEHPTNLIWPAELGDRIMR